MFIFVVFAFTFTFTVTVTATMTVTITTTVTFTITITFIIILVTITVTVTVTIAIATTQDGAAGTERGDQAGAALLLSALNKREGGESGARRRPGQPGRRAAQPGPAPERPGPVPGDPRGRRQAPIWLGPPRLEAPPALPSVRSYLPEDLALLQAQTARDAVACDEAERRAEEHADGKRYCLAAECLGEALALRKRLLGAEHLATQQAAEQLCALCNVWAVQCLSGGQQTSALELLQRAEAATDPESGYHFAARSRLRARTFGALSCYFRARGKLSAALQLAEKALRLEERSKQAADHSRTRLNYAVLLSVSGRHEEALAQNEAAAAALREDQSYISKGI